MQYMSHRRAWSLSETGEWQHCLVKHMTLFPSVASTEAAAVGQTAAERMDAINASVDALTLYEGDLGVPAVQYGFADGQHCTLYQ